MKERQDTPLNAQEKNQRLDWGLFLVLILLSLGLGYCSLGKGFDFDIAPGLSGGDGNSVLAAIKGIQENGLAGIYFNNRIGAPDGSSLIDVPGIDPVMACLIYFLSLFTASTSRIMYLYLILTFALAALSMALFLRKLGIRQEVTFVISLLFAFAPYHFYRYLVHCNLINYMSFPIAMYLACCVLGIMEEEKTWKIVAATLLLGLGFGYYYAFGLIILALAYVIRFIELEDKKQILNYLWIMPLLLFTVFASLLPKIIYSLQHGANLIAGKRVWFEQEIYGLKIIQLLLPVSYSRLGILRNITSAYSKNAPLVNENSSASLGLVASLGFIILLGVLIYSIVKRDRRVNQEWKMIDYLSLSTLALLLMGSIGGFGEIFNMLVTAQIRCYNRSSIFITGLALIMVAILLNQLSIKKKRLSFLLCAVILGIGMFDQFNIQPDNWQKDVKGKQEMYQEFFSEVESRLGEGAMVYQLPYFDYPEERGEYDYKPFVGYLFTKSLKWSYGGIKGRNESAKKLNIDAGMSHEFLQEIKEVGFSAVYIDVDEYKFGWDDKQKSDNQKEGRQVLAFYEGLGIEPMISRDGRLYVYDISKL